MNPVTHISGTGSAQIDISGTSEGVSNASGSGNERQTATPWYRTEKAKTVWRGLTIISAGVALGIGGESLINYLWKRDGVIPTYTDDTPQPIMGASLGFLAGSIIFLLDERRRTIQENSLASRSISVSSSQSEVFNTRVQISDLDSTDRASRV
ncbi:MULTISPECIES: hypothetical protein [unclassified Endozoicomonas]|uniref:hypothetical protein n=1 Tax=unclassified Endozoicomonas TaxID=2644528 RepID=UPI003BB7F3E7